MKRIYTRPKYKRKHRRRLRKSQRSDKKIPRKIRPLKRRNAPNPAQKSSTEPDKIVNAPKDFRLFENTLECLNFFRDVRDHRNFTTDSSGRRSIRITLRDVESSDCAARTVLTAISNDLNVSGITLHGNRPTDDSCWQQFVRSNFLEHFYTPTGQRFPKHNGNAEIINFEHGSRLSKDDNIRIVDLIRRFINDDEGGALLRQEVRTMILEICGNTIEWSKGNSLWHLGVMKENASENASENALKFTLTDVGVGILSTIKVKKFVEVINNIVGLSDLELLKNAFKGKYDSNSGERNRHKGLPAIMAAGSHERIRNLKLVTNNVVLCFGDDLQSKVVNVPFGGTFYEWEVIL